MTPDQLLDKDGTPLQLKLEVRLQAHENRDWRGNFRAKHELYFGTPRSMGSVPASEPHEFVPESVGFYTRDRMPAGNYRLPHVAGVKGLISTKRFVQELRKPHIPGDDNVMRFEVREVGLANLSYVVNPNFGPIPELRTTWYELHRGPGHFVRGHTLNAAQQRLNFLFVELLPEHCNSIVVWLDAMMAKGYLR